MRSTNALKRRLPRISSKWSPSFRSFSSVSQQKINPNAVEFGASKQFMDAVVCNGIRDYQYNTKEHTVPTIEDPEEVLIEVSRVGICAGDTKCFLGAPLFWDKDKFGVSYCEPPVVPGHEFIGNVVALGDAAAEKYGLQVGDQAIAEQIVPCGCCEMCLSGDYNVCNPLSATTNARGPHEIYGFRQLCHGAMSTYMKYVKNSRIHKVPKSIPPEKAVFIEPLSCGIHAANRADIQLNDTVVVSGAGSVGCAAICAAKLKSPKNIIALDTVDWKLDVAKKCGANIVCNIAKEGTDAIIDTVMQLTNGYGAHKYIELTGAPASVTQGLRILRRKGVFVEYSVFKEDVSLNMTIVSDVKELELRGGHLGPNCYPIAIDMLEKGHVPCEDIVTHCYPMSEFMKGFRKVDPAVPGAEDDKYPAESIKVTLDPQN